MVRSMTGYGRAREVLNQRDITVEIRSVNNRYLDCNIKLPRAYAFAEDTVKSVLQKIISRGKVDVYFTIDATAADAAIVSVNHTLAKEYLTALNELKSTYGLEGDVTPAVLAKFPDVLTVTKADEDLDAASGDLCHALEKALEAYNQMRAREGEKLIHDISNRLDKIEQLTARVEERSPQTVADYRQKLMARMLEVLATTAVDQSRILTEAAIFADKTAVDEETVRLRSHLSQLREMLDCDEPMGRKMDFLIQEINRESNTIGSKCNDLSIAQVVVCLKAEVEKIREQVQNIE